MAMQELPQELEQRLAKVKAGGGEKRIARQHEQGKETAQRSLSQHFQRKSP